MKGTTTNYLFSKESLVKDWDLNLWAMDEDSSLLIRYDRRRSRIKN
ncbi:hypothetical protein [Candidatus Nitrosocosmicus hydrocola]|nr:hypothetical protein [Candidatus Nitrosocosmicus hydrocola]